MEKFEIDKIHEDYERIDSRKILNLWRKRRVIRDKNGEIIACKQGGPGIRNIIELEYSLAEYYYIRGRFNLDAAKYREALVDFNTALYIYNKDMVVVERLRHIGNRKFERFEIYEIPGDYIDYKIVSEYDIYFHKIKVLQQLGAYNMIIENVQKMMQTEEYQEHESQECQYADELLIETRKILLDAYMKEKQFTKAIDTCDSLIELVDFQNRYNLKLVKSMIYEQMGEYNCALEEIKEEYASGRFYNTQDDLLKLLEILEKKQFDSMDAEQFEILEMLKEVRDKKLETSDDDRQRYDKALRQGNRLTQIMKDKGITIEVDEFLEEEIDIINTFA